MKPEAALTDLARALANHEPLQDETIKVLAACLAQAGEPDLARWAAQRRLSRGLYDRGLLTQEQARASRHTYVEESVP